MAKFASKLTYKWLPLLPATDFRTLQDSRIIILCRDTFRCNDFTV